LKLIIPHAYSGIIRTSLTRDLFVTNSGTECGSVQVVGVEIGVAAGDFFGWKVKDSKEERLKVA